MSISIEELVRLRIGRIDETWDEVQKILPDAIEMRLTRTERQLIIRKGVLASEYCVKVEEPKDAMKIIATYEELKRLDERASNLRSSLYQLIRK